MPIGFGLGRILPVTAYWLFVIIPITAQTPPTMFQGPKPFVELPAAKPPPPPPVEGATIPDTLLPPPVINPWCGAMEFGLNGAEGNSQLFNLRYAFGIRYKTESTIFTFDTLYVFATANDQKTQNRLFSIARQEWFIGGTDWGYFLDGTLEYDEFRAFDYRLASHMGCTYKFIDDGTTLAKGRAGAGASRELGGPNDNFVPELILGGDFERKLSDTCKVFATADYFPNVTEWSDYRLQMAAGIEAMLSKEYNLALKLGIMDIYDSSPEGRKPNDLNYFATLFWKF